MKIKIVNKSTNDLPSYATVGSAGMDLRANLPDFSLTLMPMEQQIIPTGLYMELPEGTFGMITPRSGLAAKYSISITNSPGIIDETYRGQIQIILINLGENPFVVNHGDRIAQMLLMKYENMDFEIVEELNTTERNDGGFGHTGIK
jgi:dUTP pyrophosphatase